MVLIYTCAKLDPLIYEHKRTPFTTRGLSVIIKMQKELNTQSPSIMAPGA